MKLFVYYLGGRAGRANIEVHDVAFAVGARYEDAFPYLREHWFGDLNGLHIDCYAELAYADGYAIEVALRSDAATDFSQTSAKLFFVNLGAYQHGQFEEVHFNKIVVATSEEEAKQRAKELINNDKRLLMLHKDKLVDVESAISVNALIDNQYLLKITKSTAVMDSVFNHGYFLI